MEWKNCSGDVQLRSPEGISSQRTFSISLACGQKYWQSQRNSDRPSYTLKSLEP